VCVYIYIYIYIYLQLLMLSLDLLAIFLKLLCNVSCTASYDHVLDSYNKLTSTILIEKCTFAIASKKMPLSCGKNIVPRPHISRGDIY
jgi:hypothetical protein